MTSDKGGGPMESESARPGALQALLEASGAPLVDRCGGCGEWITADRHGICEAYDIPEEDIGLTQIELDRRRAQRGYCGKTPTAPPAAG